MNAGWDEEMLRLELAALNEESFDINLLGFDDDELVRLLAAADATEGLTDEDAAPAPPEIPVCRPAELWILGSHKLLVGDATNSADVARLMAGEAADLVFTDLPYNCAYEGYTDEHLTIQNDRMSDADFKQFLADAFQCYRSIVKLGASLYVCHPSSYQREFQNALEAAGFEIRCQIIWAKNTFAWGFGRYKFRHEPIFYAHVAGQSDAWYGDKSQSTLWEENKPAANRLHPTMKPVELVERALVNSSKAGDIVADLFGGSGSTMIACERRSRKARLMELDPRYADVIVRRYQEYTGKRATRKRQGENVAHSNVSVESTGKETAMRNIEARLAKLEDSFSDRHHVALEWLLWLLRTIQGNDPEARTRIQACADGPITRYNTERMQAVARRVLAGLPEPGQDETAEA